MTAMKSEPSRDLELSWLAGMFEARGSIVINKSGKDAYTLRCVIVGIAKNIPELFQKQWHGFNKEITQPSNLKRQWKWAIASEKALAFLKDIMPFIHTEPMRKRAQVALEFQSEKNDKGQQLLYYRQMTELNKEKID
ncbi:MAG: hypothetical protein AABO57_06880 [Acidobacteriota bacterium]